MFKNKLLDIWKNGDAVVNAWLHIPSIWSAEVMAVQGWHSVTVDMQHGLMGMETAIQMIQMISRTDAVALARVNWNDPADIMKLLDAGAYGIICPMVNTREQAEAFVGACRYEPRGYRSLGPTRGRLYGSDYANRANDEIITMAMIETKEALNNVDDIMSVEELDSIYIGPGDLRLSLFGKGGIDVEDAEFMEAIDTILASAKKHNKVVGMHTNSTGYAKRMIEKGMQFVTMQTDTVMLRDAAQNILSEMIDTSAPDEDTSSAY